MVVPRYDLINALVTLGMDRRWRNLAARECLKYKPAKVLDICCGTGDLAICIARGSADDTEVAGIDFSQPMLDKAVLKAAKLPDKQIKFAWADIASIPFPDSCFDCIGISFAFRNLTYKNPTAATYLSEILRVIKAGGRFVIVESSQPKPKPRIINFLHKFYVRQIVFRLGWFISGDKKSYRYLAESVSKYYNADELKSLLLEAGFSQVSYRQLFFGAAAIHVAVK